MADRPLKVWDGVQEQEPKRFLRLVEVSHGGLELHIVNEDGKLVQNGKVLSINQSSGWLSRFSGVNPVEANRVGISLFDGRIAISGD